MAEASLLTAVRLMLTSVMRVTRMRAPLVRGALVAAAQVCREERRYYAMHAEIVVKLLLLHTRALLANAATQSLPRARTLGNVSLALGAMKQACLPLESVVLLLLLQAW